MKPDFKIVREDDVEFADPGFFENAYEKHFSRIYNYIRYRIWDPTVTDDLTSITFHKALDRFPTFDSSRAAFSTWLFAIARNTVNDHLRARRRRKILLFGWWLDRTADETDPESTLMANEQRDQLLAAIALLSEREKDFLGLKYAGGKTNRAIAEMTGQSENNVGVIIHRAIGKLRRRILAGEDVG